MRPLEREALERLRGLTEEQRTAEFPVDYFTDTALHPFVEGSGDDLCAGCGEHRDWHVEKEKKKRKKREETDQGRLSKWAREQWWGEGYRHHEAKVEKWETARARYAAGVRGGWPDVTVDVPRLQIVAADATFEVRGPLHLAVELKRVNLRPKRRQGLWWIAWARELAADDSWHIRPTEPTCHGLSARQAEQLAYMQQCGWETFVAYGFDEAKSWLEAQIGPRPEGKR